MSIKIWVTPTSITLADTNQNRVSVLKTTSGIEFRSSIMNYGVNPHLMSLQESIKYRLLNPEKDRDNYKARFNSLAKQIGNLKSDSFERLAKKMVIK